MIGIITKDYFFKFMKTAHDMLWKFEWPRGDVDNENMIFQMLVDYVLLMSGMDEELAEYFMDYLNEHEELNIDQLDMLYDYLAGNETNEN